MKKKKINFVINPNAGQKQKTELPQLIQTILDKNTFDVSVVFTKYAGHAQILTREFIDQKADIVVAVGGDGSINEVASQLVGTAVALGILPMGSGNGLAHKLDIPINARKALQVFQQYQIKEIDVGQYNGQYFFSSAGVGFAAEVVQQFNQKSGTAKSFLNYARLVFKTYQQFRATSYLIQTEQQQLETRAFLINFGNTGKYGYNLGPSPQAVLDDGWLDIAVCHAFPKWYIIKLLLLFMTQQTHKSRYIDIIRTKQASVTVSSGQTLPQIDGDSKAPTTAFDIALSEQKLKVVVGRK